MTKLKTKLADFNKETGESTYIYTYKEYTFIGKSQCHEDDMDMCSELVGLQLAEIRAFFKYLKIRRKELKLKLDALEGVYKNMSTSKDFNERSKATQKLILAINETRLELEDCKDGIENIPDFVEKNIQARDAMYKKMGFETIGTYYRC